MSQGGRAGRGFLRAAGGASVGVVLVGVAAAFLVEPTVGGASAKQILSFDHDGRLELDALLIYVVIALAVALGGPGGCWLALRTGRYGRAGVTALLVLPLLAALVSLILRVVPSSPGDPVLEPYAIVCAAFVAGLAARAPVVVFH